MGSKYTIGELIWYSGKHFRKGVHIYNGIVGSSSSIISSKNFIHSIREFTSSSSCYYIYQVSSNDIRPLTIAEKLLYAKNP